MYIYIHIHTYIHIHIDVLLVLSIYVVSLLASYLIFIALYPVLALETLLSSTISLSPSPLSPNSTFEAYLQPSWTLSAKKNKSFVVFLQDTFSIFFWFSDNPGQKLWQKRKFSYFMLFFCSPSPYINVEVTETFSEPTLIMGEGGGDRLMLEMSYFYEFL